MASEPMRENTPVVLRLSQPGSATAAIRALLLDRVEDILADPDRKGCFAVNTAVECLPGDEQLTRQVQSAWNTAETALTVALYRAQAQGELAADRKPAGTRQVPDHRAGGTLCAGQGP